MSMLVRQFEMRLLPGFLVKSNQSVKLLSTSTCNAMPIQAEDRLPMTEREKRLYPQNKQQLDSEGYPILKLFPSDRTKFERLGPNTRRNRYAKPEVHRRELDMEPDQDWPSCWPTAKAFVPSSVPLPLRQGYRPGGIPPGKYHNTELVKIRNFLHLTPAAIERHCKAIKKFCTKWPEGLDTDQEVSYHFPVTSITTDYVHSSASIRDPRSRVVRTEVNISSLNLDSRSQDKLIRLLGHRYCKDTGKITIITHACPVRVQNVDYANYLLTALYFESIKYEPWEDDKPECDWEKFFWEKSESKQKAEFYRSLTKPGISKEVIEKGVGDPVIEDYKQSLEKIYTHESVDNLESYRLSVEKMLGLDAPVACTQS